MDTLPGLSSGCTMTGPPVPRMVAAQWVSFATNSDPSDGMFKKDSDLANDEPVTYLN